MTDDATGWVEEHASLAPQTAASPVDAADRAIVQEAVEFLATVKSV